HQPRDASLIDHRVIIGRLYAIALQYAVAEAPSRAIASVGHAQMIATLEESKQRCGDCGKARAHDGTARAALNLGDDIFQRPVRLGATKTVGQQPLVTPSRERSAFCDRRIQDGRAAQQWRIDETVDALSRTAGV